MTRTLTDWLNELEASHPPSGIELGLTRMKTMLSRLDLRFEVPVIIVGGTNGKGSTCLMLESIYRASGRRVATHTSPHMLRFNERARFNGQELDDETLAAGFAAVEAARDDMPLTYFEFTALAILWAFKRLKPDVVILEIGLGGRLDAINALDPEASIVTTVDVEHETFLGTTREAVGWEKAHIYRKGKCAVCADDHPPEKLIAVAFDVGADLLLKGRDFYAEKVAHGMRFTYRGYTVDLPEPAMFGVNQIDNAAGALAVVYSLLKRLPVTVDDIAQGLRTAKLPGRFEKIADSPLVIVDVGHNPHAARVLVKNLEASRVPGKTYAVFGMLKDKDMSKVVELVAPEIDAWFVSGLPGVRGASEDELVRAMLQAGVRQDAITREADIPRAFEKAKEAARPEDRILVFGSFVTVTAFLEKGLA